MDLQQYLADISLKTMSQLHRAIVQLTTGVVLVRSPSVFTCADSAGPISADLLAIWHV
jgi:hypothetical protein